MCYTSMFPLLKDTINIFIFFFPFLLPYTQNILKITGITVFTPWVCFRHMWKCASSKASPRVDSESNSYHILVPRLGEHLLCVTGCADKAAHLQGLQTGVWSGPRWRRSHCTGGPGCAVPAQLHPSGGGCWTSADLDTQSHSSRVAAVKHEDFSPSSLPQPSDLITSNLRKETPPPLAVKTLLLFSS